MTNTIEVVGGINQSALTQEVSRISPHGAIAELLDNAFDAGTLYCKVVTDRPRNPTVVSVIDAGSGMNFDSLRAFFQYGRSYWTSKRHKGTNGRGSKYILGHSDKVTVRTKTADDPIVKEFDITLDSWLKIVLNQQKFSIQNDSKAGSNRLDPDNPSFTIVQFRPNDLSRDSFDEEALLEKLPELLSPQFADRVFVNDKQLKPRETLSVFEDQLQDPLLGEIRVFIYRPKSVKTREGHPIDELRIGTIGPVIDFRNFFRSLPGKLHVDVPSIFFNEDVCGLIEVEAFNPYREGASKEFRNGLYSSPEVKRFVKYLGLLGKRLADEFGISPTNMDDKAMKNLSLLQKQSTEVYGSLDDFQAETATARRKSSPQTAFHVSPRSIEIMPGETIVLTARGNKGDVFEWNADDVPGSTLSAKTGEEIELTVAKDVKFSVSDQYKVVVRNSKNTTRTIYVKISAVHDLALTPRESQKFVGEVLKLTPINIPVTTKTLDWEVETPEIGEMMKKRGTEPGYLVLKNPGRCVVTVFDPHNRQISASAVAYVKKEPTEDVRQDESPKIRVENTLIYIATFSSGDQTQMCFVEDLSTDSQRIHRVHINSDHPRYQVTLRLSGSAWREYILNMIIRTYVNDFYKDCDTEQKLGEILARFARSNMQQ
ncbi:TPA: hypothetical protein DF272_00030 [Candidatus Falkowbacteria bacterium]|nr:hypothetical protein [Candidatus Falkowbacteria bacterium]